MHRVESISVNSTRPHPTLLNSTPVHPTPLHSTPPPGIDRYLVPSLLESGHPTHDVWPDVPEWDEKQITCDFSVRAPKACFFGALLLHIARDGQRLLDIVKVTLRLRSDWIHY